jgi:seryl-tRNA synthetase
MIDLKDLRENPDKYRRGAQLKGVSIDVDAILSLDERRRQHLQAFERARAEQNQASTQIGKLKDPAEKQAAIARVATLKDTVKAEDERAKALDAELLPLLLTIPQPPDDDVPVGTDATSSRSATSSWASGWTCSTSSAGRRSPAPAATSSRGPGPTWRRP